MKRAIISVSNKAGIVEFAQGLESLGIEIISTGGTAKVLHQAGLDVKQISEITKFPEMMDGRVKTLHPHIHGGILARRSKSDDLDQLSRLGISPIDLVIVNLYPFQETIERSGVQLEEILENIDIGGPTLIRAAAKNFPDVAVVVDQSDYPTILQELRREGDLDLQHRMSLATKAFQHTADYDLMIAQYFQQKIQTEKSELFPQSLQFSLEKVQDLRYGENPHQAAAFYRERKKSQINSVSTAKKLYGKELSFNNLNDANGALELVREFSEPAAVVIKHTNPCGAALGSSLAEAFQKAYAGDPLSAYGSVVALNRSVDLATAEMMTSGKKFIEIILAPSYQPEALELIKQRWKNIRVMEVGELVPYSSLPSAPLWDIKQIQGGLLMQELDREVFAPEMEVVSQKAPLVQQMKDLEFAWQVCKHVKSNAITLVKDGMVIGVGAGQLSRVDSMKIAIRKAGERIQGAVAASDAFFPFRDSIDEAAAVGVNALIQPGGSVRDEEIITACDELDLVMVFTKMRHFKH